jgi:hypothetical protein
MARHAVAMSAERKVQVADAGQIKKNFCECIPASALRACTCSSMRMHVYDTYVIV